MEKNTERKTLSYSKGITNVPSDLLSEDTELAECEGFIYKDGEMKPIQEPVKIGTVSGKLMYVHKGADYENFITIDELPTEDSEYSYCNISFYKREQDGFTEIASFTVPKVLTVCHVGNTVVCASTTELRYFLYEKNTYRNINLKDLDNITVQFTFEPFDKLDDKDRTVLNLNEIIGYSETNAWYDSDRKFIQTGSQPDNGVNSKPYYHYYVTQKNLTSFYDGVTGHVSGAINWAKSNNVFAFPFYVRYALKLYDGTLTKISKPILLYPTINRNGRFRRGSYATGDDGYPRYSPIAVDKSCEFFYFFDYSELLIKITGASASRSWKDIVREIVVYASEQVVPFNVDDDWSFKDASNVNNTVFANSMYEYGSTYCKYNEQKYNFLYNAGGSVTTEAYCALTPTYKTDEEIKEELLGKSIFYKLLTIDFDSAYKYESEYHHTIDRSDISKSIYPNTDILRIPKNALSTLTEQEQMKDDYFGWCNITASTSYLYNNRINLAGVTRITPGVSTYGNMYYGGNVFDIYAYILSPNQEGWLKVGTGTSPDTLLNSWFFFFHPYAKTVVFYNSEKGYISRKLKTHPRLNGSYAFTELPSDKVPEFTSGTLDSIGVNAGDFNEHLYSNIFTSVANNPFVFEASGDNTVGTGKILGVMANTTAISQGQFGQYPMLAFTSEGIYAMGLNSEGVFTNIHPMSREVCNEKSPFIPTDSQVFFTSEKGLMSVAGAQVVCCSNQMRGRKRSDISGIVGEFMENMKDCLIAYDYRDSLLRIFCTDKDTQFVYNMTDGTFATDNSGVVAQAVVNDYPDNLIQDKDGNVYSLTAKPDINEDTNTFDGSIITRPLKLGGSIYLKSLRAVKHLMDTNDGKLKFHVYGSNNGKTWQKLASLKGKPWKYFQFIYDLSGFKACDSFAGSIVDVQTRRDDKMR